MPTGTKRNTKIVDGAQWNQCTKCEEWFPATEKYFHFRSDKHVLYAKCKKCQNEQSKNKPSQQPDKRRAYGRKYIKRPYVKKKRKEWGDANKELCSRQQKQWREDNTEHVLNYREANRERDRLKSKAHYTQNKETYLDQSANYMLSNASFTKYIDRLTVDEVSKPDKDGNLLVKCTYCGRYFIPTNREVLNRISVLGGGKNLYGEARLYCSEGCKAACPLFNRQEWPKGFKPASSREVNPLIRQMCLERDNYECQKCGATIDQIELHAHHYEGAVQQPMLANDVDNTITLCKPCHIWVHQQKGCTNYDLRCEK